jgi:hypothetical protein
MEKPTDVMERINARVGLTNLVHGVGSIQELVITVNDNTKPAIEEFLEYVYYQQRLIREAEC